MTDRLRERRFYPNPLTGTNALRSRTKARNSKSILKGLLRVRSTSSSVAGQTTQAAGAGWELTTGARAGPVPALQDEFGLIWITVSHVPSCKFDLTAF